MRKWVRPFDILLAAAMLVGLLVSSGRVAYAAGPVLHLEVTSAVGAATRVPIVAVLTTDSGKPIAGARIIFQVDGQRDGEARTDAQGRAEWRIRRNLSAGVYALKAIVDDPSAAQASVQLVVAPAQLKLSVGPTTAHVGDPLDLFASLTTPAGEPVADAPVTFLVNGERDGTARTAANGQAAWRIRRSLSAGAYTVEATFDGRVPLLSARATGPLVIAPALLEVRTVPALPGTRFTLDGREFTTGQDGIAQIGVDRMGVYSLTVSAGDTIAPRLRSEFAGWDDGEYALERSVKIPAKGVLGAGFNLHYLVTPRFADSQDREVDPARVSSLTLTSSIGRRQTVDRIQPFWIQGSRVVDGPESLEQREITYTVERVLVDGANVVNQSQQRLVSSAGSDWTIQVLFYSAHFIARDALFGFPTGSGILLSFPDGHSQTLQLGSGGEVTVDALPRGQYRVKLEGPGFASTRPLALSRSQDVSILLVSYLDLGIIFGFLALVALGLLLLGRGSYLRRTLSRRVGLRLGQGLSAPQDPETLAHMEEQC